MGRIVRAPGDFWAGAIFAGAGIAALLLGRSYRLGTLLSMGPGYFPRMVGILLTILGVATIGASLRGRGEPSEVWRWRPIVLILASVLLFGWTLERFGLVVASALLVLVACFAERERRVWEAIAVATALTFIAWLVFVKGLEMPLLVWPAITRAD